MHHRAEFKTVLRVMLEADGFRVVTSDTCMGGEREAASRPPDAMIVSMGVPDRNGIGLIKAIRTWSLTPILVLSARSAESRRLAAFDAGADDYILKPFSSPELLARVRAALRFHARGGWLPTGVLELDNLSIDLGRRIVRQRDGHELDLTRLEYRVLETLARGRNRVVTQAKIMTEVWGPNSVKSLEGLLDQVKDTGAQAQLEITSGRIASGPFDRSINGPPPLYHRPEPMTIRSECCDMHRLAWTAPIAKTLMWEHVELEAVRSS